MGKGIKVLIGIIIVAVVSLSAYVLFETFSEKSNEAEEKSEFEEAKEVALRFTEEVMEGVAQDNEEYTESEFWGLSGEKFSKVFSEADLTPLRIEAVPDPKEDDPDRKIVYYLMKDPDVDLEDDDGRKSRPFFFIYIDGENNLEDIYWETLNEFSFENLVERTGVDQEE